MRLWLASKTSTSILNKSSSAKSQSKLGNSSLPQVWGQETRPSLIRKWWVGRMARDTNNDEPLFQLFIF